MKVPRRIKKGIPQGVYCYTSLGMETRPDGRLLLRTKLCPFFFHNELGYGDCKLLVKFGDKPLNGSENEFDPGLDDQCKACGVKMGR